MLNGFNIAEEIYKSRTVYATEDLEVLDYKLKKEGSDIDFHMKMGLNAFKREGNIN